MLIVCDKSGPDGRCRLKTTYTGSSTPLKHAGHVRHLHGAYNDFEGRDKTTLRGANQHWDYENGGSYWMCPHAKGDGSGQLVCPHMGSVSRSRPVLTVSARYDSFDTMRNHWCRHDALISGSTALVAEHQGTSTPTLFAPAYRCAQPGPDGACEYHSRYRGSNSLAVHKEHRNLVHRRHMSYKHYRNNCPLIRDYLRWHRDAGNWSLRCDEHNYTHTNPQTFSTHLKTLGPHHRA